MNSFFLRISVITFAATALLTSCRLHEKIILDNSVPQELGLNLVKVTDETKNSVISNKYLNYTKSLPSNGYAGCSKLAWDTGARLCISPDGKELAYLSYVDKAPNIMIRSSQPNSTSSQRTFRRVQTISWAADGNLYFNDNSDNKSTICSTDAHSGNLVKQITSNNNDWSPSVSDDGKMLYFTRYDNVGPYIWAINLDSGELLSCTRGYNAVTMRNSPMKILCTRNSAKGNSEIWMIDLQKGDETLLLTDAEKGFSDPVVSPDGKWVLVVGSSLSNISGRYNTDIYAVRTDGTQLTQITHHPEVDNSPAWSPDGKFIYFISSRGNKERRFNIWRINNPLF